MGRGECWDVAIVGAGMAGLGTAVWARRLGLSAVVLEAAPQEGGQLRAIQGHIVDYPGLGRLRGRTLADRLRRQAEAAGAELRLEQPVRRIDGSTRTCQTDGGSITAGAVVLATGLSRRRLGVPGEAEFLASPLLRRPSRAPQFYRDKRVAVVGGGDRALENALLLARVAGRVYLIHRREGFRARPDFQQAIAGEPIIEPLLRTEVRAMRLGGAAPLTLELMQGDIPLALPVDTACIYIGNQPNTELLQGQVEQTESGYIVTDGTGRTSLPGIYAVGDVCTPPQFQSLVTAAGQAMAVAKQIALKRSET